MQASFYAALIENIRFTAIFNQRNRPFESVFLLYTIHFQADPTLQTVSQKHSTIRVMSKYKTRWR